VVLVEVILLLVVMVVLVEVVVFLLLEAVEIHLQQIQFKEQMEELAVVVITLVAVVEVLRL
jgi:hypothetical protein